MTIEEIKQKIVETHPSWYAADDSTDGDKYTEIDEGYIRELIANYFEDHDYAVDDSLLKKGMSIVMKTISHGNDMKAILTFYV